MSTPTENPAFTALAAAHLDAAYNLARWLTRDASSAEDCVQDAYLRAFRFFDGFRGGDGRAWLLKIVRNSCYTWLKQQKRDQQYVEYNDEFAGLAQQDDNDALHASNPQTQLLREADVQQIEAALLRLPPEFREILVLRELQEMSYKQIADIAGIAMGTVMSRLSRARKELRRVLCEDGNP